MYAVSRSAIVIVQSSPPPCVPISAVWSREISGFRYWFPRLVSVMSLHDTNPWERGRGSRKPRVPQISRSLHANRLRRVAPSPPSHLTSSISSSRPLLDVVLLLLLFLRIQFSWMHRGVWQRSCGFLLVIFERRCARMGEGRKEGEGCFFGATVVRPDTFYRAVNAGFYRRMRRTRTNRRIVLWPSADLSSSTTSTLPFLGPPPLTIVSGTRSTRFYASLFNSDCVFCPIRPRQPD